MRALTITQPWAGLIAASVKLVENRPRSMIKREDFGKPFAIHASREIDESVYAGVMDISPDICALDYSDGMIVQVIRLDSRWYKLSRITSAVIAIATIDKVLDPRSLGIDPDSDDARSPLAPDQRRWFSGPIGYVLRDVTTLPSPVPCKGALGFWTLTADVEAKVREQLGAA